MYRYAVYTAGFYVERGPTSLIWKPLCRGAPMSIGAPLRFSFDYYSAVWRWTIPSRRKAMPRSASEIVSLKRCCSVMPSTMPPSTRDANHAPRSASTAIAISTLPSPVKNCVFFICFVYMCFCIDLSLCIFPIYPLGVLCVKYLTLHTLMGYTAHI